MFDNWCFVTFENHEKQFKYAATRVERVSCREFSDLARTWIWALSRVPTACNLLTLALSIAAFVFRKDYAMRAVFALFIGLLAVGPLPVLLRVIRSRVGALPRALH